MLKSLMSHALFVVFAGWNYFNPYLTPLLSGHLSKCRSNVQSNSLNKTPIKRLRPPLAVPIRDILLFLPLLTSLEALNTRSLILL